MNQELKQEIERHIENMCREIFSPLEKKIQENINKITFDMENYGRLIESQQKNNTLALRKINKVVIEFKAVRFLVEENSKELNEFHKVIERAKNIEEKLQQSIALTKKTKELHAESQKITANIEKPIHELSLKGEEILEEINIKTQQVERLSESIFQTNKQKLNEYYYELQRSFNDYVAQCREERPSIIAMHNNLQQQINELKSEKLKLIV